ncbi:WD40/YVTN/BNR-like repeat-containing protein [Parasphingopyxis marina]|uniref:WD40/YVTN/BNR-like repeat-containing protein n=1 Tax=Parasphingopyxis marina TaxID=2761622 RepID=UPI001C8DB21F|nr:glycosyl hydrolase [Parasphingopyxis marina]
MPICLSPNGKTEYAGSAPPDELIVGTLRGIHFFERTGGTWECRRTALDHLHISALLHEPESGKLFAGCHGYGEAGGLFVSDDGGAHWDKCVEGLVHEHIYTIAAQKRPDGIVLYAGTEPPGLFRSVDLGASWEELPGILKVPGTDKWTFPPPPHIAHVKQVAFHPNHPDTVYVLIEQGAVLKSEDRGESWRELDSYASDADSFYRDVHRLAFAQNDPARLHLATGDGLYRSEDAGETWEHLQGRTDRVGYPDALFVDPDDDDIVYLGGAGDAPETWRTEGGAFAGFIVSVDAGDSWQERMAGLPDPIEGNVEAMAMFHWPGGAAFFAGTAVGDVFISEDRGAHWALLTGGLPPISKARHYRHFLSADEKARIEGEARSEAGNAA